MKFWIFFIFIVLFFGGVYLATTFFKNTPIKPTTVRQAITQIADNPLSIETLRKRDYPGSDIKIEETLAPGATYKQYIASYVSDGYKIYGLLTVPDGNKPKNGWPAIVFDHGYIQPEQYSTTERYVQYVADLANSKYVVFKIDYRGNGNSEGQPAGAYFSPGYTVDTINAAESLKKLDYVDKAKIGVWGHSMAGMIVTRALAVRPHEFQAAVIWGGVLGSYTDLFNYWWNRPNRPAFAPSQREQTANRPTRDNFIKQYGQPNERSIFWLSISPKNYADDITTPIQLDAGEADEEVPPILSQIFYNTLKSKRKTVELYTYPGADHNISAPSYNLAMQRTITFFDKYLK